MLFTLVFGGAEGLDDGDIDQRILLHHDACFRDPLVYGVEGLACQLALL